MNTFSSLLSLARWEHGLTLRELASGSGVDASTISRIERGSTSATLLTAYLICQRLALPLPSIAASLLDSDLSVLKEFEGPNIREVLTEQDLRDALLSFQMRREVMTTWFAEILNLIKQAAGGQGESAPFTSAMVNLLLHATPLCTATLHCPSGSSFTSATLVSIYRRGGILTLEDVRTYVTLVIRECQERRIPLAHEVAAHFLEVSPDRIRLDEVLRLDEKLSQNGLLLALTWRACQFHLAYAVPGSVIGVSTDLESRWITSFVIACRWLEQVCIPGQSWLLPIRSYLRRLIGEVDDKSLSQGCISSQS